MEYLFLIRNIGDGVQSFFIKLRLINTYTVRGGTNRIFRIKYLLGDES